MPPTSAMNFTVPGQTGKGTSTGPDKVRIDEIEESISIIEQALDSMPGPDVPRRDREVPPETGGDVPGGVAAGRS